MRLGKHLMRLRGHDCHDVDAADLDALEAAIGMISDE